MGTGAYAAILVMLENFDVCTVRYYGSCMPSSPKESKHLLLPKAQELECMSVLGVGVMFNHINSYVQPYIATIGVWF